MGDIFDIESSTLLCDETSDLCFDDDGGGGTIIDYECAEIPLGNNLQVSVFINGSSPSSESLIQIPVQSDEVFGMMIKKENDYLPHYDYLSRLRNGDLEVGIRRQAFDWISKAHAHYNYGPLTLCLSINYLDRFLSVCCLRKDRAWAVQLLAVACFSIAVKMEETDAPPTTIGLQVGQPEYLFDAKTIQRMEFILLSALNWKTSVLTPISFLDYYLHKITDDHRSIHDAIGKSIPLILSTTRDFDFLEFKPSEIAAAVAMSVSSGQKYILVNVDDAISTIKHLEKDRVVKCMELIKDLPMKTSSTETGVDFEDNATRCSVGSGPGLCYDPIGVLDTSSACFSYETSDLFLIFGSRVLNPASRTTTTTTTTTTTDSAATRVTDISPCPKRMKLDPKPPPPPSPQWPTSD